MLLSGDPAQQSYAATLLAGPVRSGSLLADWTAASPDAKAPWRAPVEDLLAGISGADVREALAFRALAYLDLTAAQADQVADTLHGSPRLRRLLLALAVFADRVPVAVRREWLDEVIRSHRTWVSREAGRHVAAARLGPDHREPDWVIETLAPILGTDQLAHVGSSRIPTAVLVEHLTGNPRCIESWWDEVTVRPLSHHQASRLRRAAPPYTFLVHRRLGLPHEWAYSAPNVPLALTVPERAEVAAWWAACTEDPSQVSRCPGATDTPSTLPLARLRTLVLGLSVDAAPQTRAHLLVAWGDAVSRLDTDWTFASSTPPGTDPEFTRSVDAVLVGHLEDLLRGLTEPLTPEQRALVRGAARAVSSLATHLDRGLVKDVLYRQVGWHQVRDLIFVDVVLDLLLETTARTRAQYAEMGPEVLATLIDGQSGLPLAALEAACGDVLVSPLPGQPPS